jgi:hypothetical protein
MAAPALFKKLYRAFTWVTLAGFILSVILVLHARPHPQAYDPRAAAHVEEKFAAADQAKASGQPAQVQLNGSELNSYLTQNLQLESQPATAAGQAPAGSNPAGSPAASPSAGPPPSSDPATALTNGEQPTLEQVQSSVKDVKVDMQGDLVKAYVIFDFHGKDLSLELDGHLRTENGYLRFDPVSGTLGSMPIPQAALHTAVEKLMASPENREKLRLPADISDIEIANGQALITYK